MDILDFPCYHEINYLFRCVLFCLFCRALSLEVVMKKMLYINLFDRNGVFRCSVANGDYLPAGVIAGKGWRVKITFENVEYCEECKSYTTHHEHCSQFSENHEQNFVD